ncbi:MAG: replication initiation protein [Candidatus Contendobacter sp.]|nr:replication initiation protein [Candidatus Contendobacter sp.]MDS4058623.1 replication initiation protein [Candidatus Contendobacter sp.]
MSPDITDLLGNDVRKPTALVHFERDMPLTEQKVMTLIIFHCQVADKDESGFYHIRKNFVRRFLGWDDSHNYPRIYEAFEKIFDNTIRWNLLGKDKTFKSLKCKLIVSLLEPTDTGPFIGFKLHPDLEPAIKDPRLFARIKLIMMAILAKPKYAFPLYEILADCYSRGERVIRLSLQELKESLGIAGPYYDQFIAFKKEVLRPNLAAINQNTDCQVTYDTYREGRKVAGVVFTIDKQDWRPPLLEEHLRELQSYYQPIPVEPPALSAPPAPSADEQKFVDSVKRHQVAEADALQAIRTHGLNGARAIRDYALRQATRRKGSKDQVRDLGAYMARCFREGYGRWEEQDPLNVRRAEAPPPEEQPAREAASETERLAAKFKTAFRAHQSQLVDERLGRMSAEERARLDDEFAARHPIWAQKFRELGPTTPLLRSAFEVFAVEVLLDPEQKDVVAFARERSASAEVVEWLQRAA